MTGTMINSFIPMDYYTSELESITPDTKERFICWLQGYLEDRKSLDENALEKIRTRAKEAIEDVPYSVYRGGSTSTELKLPDGVYC